MYIIIIIWYVLNEGKRGVYCRSDVTQICYLLLQPNFTGSQCSSFSNGVIWSRLRFFWTLCDRPICRRQAGQDWVAVIKAGGYQSGDKSCRSAFLQGVLIQEKRRDKRCWKWSCMERDRSNLTPRYITDVLKGILLPPISAESVYQSETRWSGDSYYFCFVTSVMSLLLFIHEKTS